MEEEEWENVELKQLIILKPIKEVIVWLITQTKKIIVSSNWILLNLDRKSIQVGIMKINNLERVQMGKMKVPKYKRPIKNFNKELPKSVLKPLKICLLLIGI